MNTISKVKNWPVLIFAILLCLSAGIVGSFLTISSIPTWYTTLNKPFFSPPNWVFAPAWTTLYILMGASLYMVWVSKSKMKQKGVNLFFIQLGLNALWSVLFFGMKSPILGLADIVSLWVMIFLTIKSFYSISRLSAYLLIPYILWVSFASLLNLSIVLLN